jgi:hypothetical protein
MYLAATYSVHLCGSQAIAAGDAVASGPEAAHIMVHK